MSLLTIVLVLLFEQQQAFPVQRWVREPMQKLAVLLSEKLNDGSRGLGVLAWVLVVVLPTLLVLLVHTLLLIYQPVLALIWAFIVLYVTLGFRQFSHFFTTIQLALQADDIAEARRILTAWRGRNSDRLRAQEVARLSIEHGLLSSHRYVFAPMFWFVLLGPSGSVLYRLAHTLDAAWQDRSEAEFGQFGQFARQAFALLDWMPVRVTAAAFAVVGDFEDSVQCWRTQAERWPERAAGILLASGAGALGVKLGMPVRDSGQGDVSDRPELGLGEDADVDFMQGAIGLVWRSLVFFLAVLALIWVSGWVGG